MKKVTQNWITQAEVDYDSAKYNFDGERFDVASYLCQQSVEKGLKALYLQKKDELWKTHDLVKLAMLVTAPNDIVDACNHLNPIYFEDRYPDYADEIPANKFTSEDIEEFLKKAEKVIKWIKKELD